MTRSENISAMNSTKEEVESLRAQNKHQRDEEFVVPIRYSIIPPEERIKPICILEHDL